MTVTVHHKGEPEPKPSIAQSPEPYTFLKVPPIDPKVWQTKAGQMGKTLTKELLFKSAMMDELKLMREMYGITSVMLGDPKKEKKMTALSDFADCVDFRLEEVRLALEEYQEQMLLSKAEREDMNELEVFCKEYKNYDEYTRFWDGSDSEDYAREWADGMHNVDYDCWPFDCIDWSEAASSLLSDKTEVNICGNYFYIDD